MQSKISSKQLWFVVGVGGIIFFLIMSLPLLQQRTNGKTISSRERSSQQYLSEHSAAALRAIAAKQVTSGIPVRLSIPVLRIDAPLEYVGLTPEGVVDIPQEPTNPAWFNLGPRPGEIGNAIIVGHFGWKNNTAAVFDSLSALHEGDHISVTDAEGTTTTFIVREIKLYRQNEDTSDVFVSQDEKAHLNLITCAGTWSKILKSYSHRLVVFTDQVTTP